VSIETEIRARLVADATIAALAKSGSVTRIYALFLPQDPTLPAITYQRISGPRIQRLNDATEWGQARIQYDCWATTYLGAQTLAAAVRISLNGFVGELATLKVAIRLDNERDLYEDELHIFRISQDYMVTHTE
jgi:hypothetical protein